MSGGMRYNWAELLYIIKPSCHHTLPYCNCVTFSTFFFQNHVVILQCIHRYRLGMNFKQLICCQPTYFSLLAWGRQTCYFIRCSVTARHALCQVINKSPAFITGVCNSSRLTVENVAYVLTRSVLY